MQAANLYSYSDLSGNACNSREGKEMTTIGYKPSSRLTPEEIEVRVWAFVIFAITLILTGSCGMYLYSVSFVTQPMAGMAPIDKVYTQQLSNIMLLCTGVLGGVAGRSVISASAKAVAKAEVVDNDELPKP